MKKIVLLLFTTFLVLPAFAQNGPIDFEMGGIGADWTGRYSENDTNPAVEIVSNPDMSGGNSSATVAKFTALASGNPWAGCETMHGADLGTFTVDATNSTIKIMVWKPVISDVGIKLVAADGSALPEIKIPNTTTNQWEEISFDFSAQIGMTYDQIVIFPDFLARAQDNIIYFDNITFGDQTTTNEPMTAAPDPTNDPSTVISMFSGVYTDVPVDTWQTSWSAATLEDIQIQGNDTKKYSGMDFVGVETVTNTIDASAMTHMHLDMWSPDATFFAIKLVDFGADGAFGGGDDTEHQIDIPNPAQGQWVGLDLALGDFVNLASTEHLAQYIFVAQPTGSANVYIDNVFFYQETTVSEPMTAAPDPTNDPSTVISLFSGVYTDVPVDTWQTSWSAGTLEDIQIQGNDTKKYTSLDFVGIETVANTIDASNMTHFRLDMWSPDATLFAIKLVDFGADGAFGGGDDTEHQIDIANPAQGEWVTLDIPLTDFVGLTSTEHMAQYILVAQPTGTSTVYVDNVFFYNDASSVSSFSENNIQLFPNPTRSSFTIATDKNIEEVRIYDVVGSLVMRENVLDQNNRFDIAHLANGTYFVLAIIEGQTMVERLIKN